MLDLGFIKKKFYESSTLSTQFFARFRREFLLEAVQPQLELGGDKIAENVQKVGVLRNKLAPRPRRCANLGQLIDLSRIGAPRTRYER